MLKQNKTRGQAMTEYIIIVVLCAIGLLLVVTFFGNDIKEMFYTASASVRGGKQQKIEYSEEILGTKHDKADGDHTTGDLDNEH